MKAKNAYATVVDSDGVNYREIADTMTSIGFKMNHSSARNYVLRVMRKFATSLLKEWDVQVSNDKLEQIIKSPLFQQGICDVLQAIDEQSSNRKVS
jgi:hypothetical protein